jgi:hypothetical protein
MSRAWPATLAVLGVFAISGCRTAGVESLTRREPPPVPPTLDVRAVIDDHNRNAEAIATLEAQPSLVVWARRRPLPVEGRLALERPRNFKLDIRHTASEVADIGSNDDKFWFWVRDNSDKAVYFCKYDEAGGTPLIATMQPDWIVEALGLRVIPEEEADEIKVSRGETPGTLVLTHRPTRTGGETTTRITIVSESTHRIKEHRLCPAGDPKTILAKAVIDDYMEVPDSEHPDEKVYIPRKIKLDWVREKLAMEVTFHPRTTKVNTQFDSERRAALFVQVDRPGYEPYDLARDAKSSYANARESSGNETIIRDTRPAPPAGVELGEPAAEPAEGAARTERSPVALSAELPAIPSLKDDLIGPAMPRAPELQFARPVSLSGWRSASVSGLPR